MKTLLEPDDIQTLANAVAEVLKPHIARNAGHKAEDIVYDKKELAEYLRLSESTINKLVMNKQIPHFKIQPGQSGGVRFFKRDIDKWINRQTVPDSQPFKGKPAC